MQLAIYKVDTWKSKEKFRKEDGRKLLQEDILHLKTGTQTPGLVLLG